MGTKNQSKIIQQTLTDAESFKLQTFNAILSALNTRLIDIKNYLHKFR